MTETTGKKAESILFWCLGMVLCALGVCFSAKSGFGVSMIEAPVYVLHLKLSQFWPWYTFGMSEYVLQAVLLAVMCAVIGKFRWKYLLSFATAFVFGWLLDGWNYVFRNLPADSLALRIGYAVLGCVVVACAVSMFFHTKLPVQVWELFVIEVSKRFGRNVTKFKLAYDMSSLFVGVILMLALFGTFRWDAVGPGTIITTFVNAPIIGFFLRLEDRLLKKLHGEPEQAEKP